MSNNQRLILRCCVLFFVGVFFTLILHILQEQRLKLNKSDVFATLTSADWWRVAPITGTGAVIAGMLYPFFDHIMGESHKYDQEWTNVIRCVAIFVGINHATAKIDYANNWQLTLTLAALSIGLWYLFDKSWFGLGLGIFIAVSATVVMQILVNNGFYHYKTTHFLYIKSWLPCVFFSGGITIGSIGRLLSKNDNLKLHTE